MTTSPTPTAVGPSSSLPGDNNDAPLKQAASVATESSAQGKNRGRFGYFDWSGPALPSHDGEHQVGTLTVEVPVPSNISHPPCPLRFATPPNDLALHLDTVLLKLYYPCSPAPKTHYPRPRWLGTSVSATSQGYDRFVKLGWFASMLLTPIAWLVLARTRLPVYGGAPPAPLTPAEQKSGQKRPLLLFCHGLAGTHLTYSQYCGQLASRGIVVASIEHRDGSAPYSVVNLPGGRVRQVPHSTMDDLSDETRPSDSLIARAWQLAQRAAELMAASEVLARLSQEGGWKSLKEANLRTKGRQGWEGDDGENWGEADWQQFAGAIEWDKNVTVAGHSFGGGTVVAALRHPSHPTQSCWSNAILLDPWLEPLAHWPSNSPPLLETLPSDVPVLTINSPGFTVWKSHFSELMKAMKSTPSGSWLLSVGGITHTAFSDFTILFERLSKLSSDLKLSPYRAMDIFVNSSLEFLGRKDPNVEETILKGKVEEGGEVGMKERSPGEVVVHWKS